MKEALQIIGVTIACVVALFFFVFLIVGLATPHTEHFHIATHVDDPGTPETHLGDCYVVESYDLIHNGFLWMSSHTENTFSGRYCLEK